MVINNGLILSWGLADITCYAPNTIYHITCTLPISYIYIIQIYSTLYGSESWGQIHCATGVISGTQINCMIYAHDPVSVCNMRMNYLLIGQ